MVFHAAVAGALLALALTSTAARADDVLTMVGGNFPPSVVDVEDIVAQSAGYFKDEHLTVTKDFAGNAAACFSAAASGKADICSSSVEPAILGYSKASASSS